MYGLIQSFTIHIKEVDHLKIGTWPGMQWLEEAFKDL